MANVLKLLRNNQLFATREAALANINAKAQTLGDGEMWVATYGQDGTAKSIIAIKRTWGTTIFDLEAITSEIEENLFNYKMVKLTAEEIAALADGANVKEAYKIVKWQGAETGQTTYTQAGEIVKIYKDTSLIDSYLGADTDTVNASSGVITKYVYELISDPTTQITAAEYEELTQEQKALYQEIDSQSLNFVYQNADGTYQMVKIDVSKFLAESEFGDGLEVSNAGVVSIKIDANEEHLSVDSDGLKLVDVPSSDDLQEIERVTSAALNDLEARKAEKSDLEDLADDALTDVTGGNGITVGLKSNNSQEISVKLDTVQDDNVLELGSNGLYLSETIDCGNY